MRSSSFQSDRPDVLVGLVAAATTVAISTPAIAAGSDVNTPGQFLLLGGIIAVFLAIFFLPSIVAFRRRHPNRWAILVLNGVFGGTGLGWLGTLVWAFHAVHRSPTGNNGGESGLNLSANDAVQIVVASAEPNEPSLSARLRELAKLKEENLIDESEYQRLRDGLIGKL